MTADSDARHFNPESKRFNLMLDLRPRLAVAFLILLLMACQESPNPAAVHPTAQPSANPQPTEVLPGSELLPAAEAHPTATLPASLDPTAPVAVASGNPNLNLSDLQSLELLISNPYLNAQGESLTLQPVLKDANGQTLNAADFPLAWFSSRPADFAIDATGKVTALVDYGYSQITLRVPGTALEASQLVSVTIPTGSGGGSVSGGTTAGPTQEDVNGKIEFQF